MQLEQAKIPANKIYPAGPPGFVSWLRDRMPQVYSQVKTMQPELVEPERLRVIARPGAKLIGKAKNGSGYYQCEMTDLDYEGYNYRTGDYQLWGLGQETAEPAEKSTMQSWVDKITSIATPLLNVYQQKEMVDLQIQRAKQGLPPLPDDALAAKVKVTTGIDRYIPWIAGGVGLLALLVIMRQPAKKRR